MGVACCGLEEGADPCSLTSETQYGCQPFSPKYKPIVLRMCNDISTTVFPDIESLDVVNSNFQKPESEIATDGVRNKVSEREVWSWRVAL